MFKNHLFVSPVERRRQLFHDHPYYRFTFKIIVLTLAGQLLVAAFFLKNFLEAQELAHTKAISENQLATAQKDKEQYRLLFHQIDQARTLGPRIANRVPVTTLLQAIERATYLSPNAGIKSIGLTNLIDNTDPTFTDDYEIKLGGLIRSTDQTVTLQAFKQTLQNELPIAEISITKNVQGVTPNQTDSPPPSPFEITIHYTRLRGTTPTLAAASSH